MKGGFRGGPPQGGNPLAMVNALMERMKEAQEELAAKTVEAQAGGGMVTAVANGALELTALRIDETLWKDLAASGDREMLQDLCIAAVNEVMRSARALADAEMKKATGGMLPPGFGF